MYRIVRIMLVTVVTLFIAQASFAEPLPNSMLDPKPYDPAVDPDIDMFIGDWRDSSPRNIHGSLVVRDILTRNDGGDNLRPPRKGACLTELISVSYATLEPGASTKNDKLADTQEIYYIVGGKGVLTSGGKSYDLYNGSGAVIPPDVEFRIQSTGTDHLAMYLVVEPVPDGFTPKKKVGVRNEFDGDQFISVHWANIDRGIVGQNEGTAVMRGLTAVKIDPMTMAQPHSHFPGVEEVWIAIRGDLRLQFGKQFRCLPVGAAYKIPDNGITAHANINFSDDTQAKLVHMMKSLPGKAHPYAQLDPSLLDYSKDPDIDMFMGDWRREMPRNMYGSLVVRDILVSLEGDDPVRPTRDGACLTDLEAVTRATLEAGAHTKPVTLDGRQEIYYVSSGTGVLETENRRVELRKGIALLIPPGVEFEMVANGDENLAMFRIVEPVPDGFKPRKDILVRDEYAVQGGNYSHWVYNGKGLFSRKDGLAVLWGIGPITLDAMTFGHPHSHEPGIEEVWVGLEGDAKLLLGKQLRKLPAGAAYKIPPTGITAHSNINPGTEPIKLMWMMKLPE